MVGLVFTKTTDDDDVILIACLWLFCEFVKKVKDLLQQQMEYLYLMLKIRNFFVQNFKLVVEL